MRFKLFLTIFIVLIITAFSISAIHFHFFRLERLRLIELNLQQNATLILDSDLTLTKKDFLKKGEQYLDTIIGDDKVNMIVVIYNENGKMLYKNNNADIFSAPITVERNFKEWVDVETNDYFIKYLTIKDEQQKRYIRVGMILNQSLLRWKYLSQRVTLFGMIVLVFISIISYFLTMLLFKPIHDLASYVNVMTEKLGAGDTNDFNSILNISTSRFNDEFGVLLMAISKLSNKISESHNITKKWSALMAHELRTPLTILKNKIEILSQDINVDQKKIEAVDEEMGRVEKIIGSFLEWASFESDPAKPEIHAVSLEKRLGYIVGILRDAFDGADIEMIYHGDPEARIFCNPVHFDQLVTNLITNALKYGKGKTLVECSESVLTISDEGEGVPLEVLENLGSPFNYLKKQNIKGFGLGLAWVGTICRKYGWSLDIQPGSRNKISINF